MAEFQEISHATPLERSDIGALFFIGIGGIGMSALARFFRMKGYRVGGYDRTESRLTAELIEEGISVTTDERVEAIPEEFKRRSQTLVVVTPAIPNDQAQLEWFKSEGFMIRKRSEVLGEVTKQMRALCVAGTHGKTTTSTILAHLMYQSEIGCNAFLGGIANNYGTNLLTSAESNYVVVEADEFDRSFHRLTPYMSVVTSVDPDHLDIYGDAEGFKEGFEHYTSLIRPGGALLLREGTELTPRLQKGVKFYTYSGAEGSGQADFRAENVTVRDGQIRFDFVTPRMRIESVKMGVPVYINIENSVAAMAIAWLNGVNETELRLGVGSYTGIYRRFNIHLNTEKAVYIDDYAHHPTELRCSIDSVRRLYPSRKLTGIFQPHLYTRTRDFAEGFAEALSMLDEVILLPIYPAREEPIAGVTSEMLLDHITCEKKRVVSKEDLTTVLKGRQGEVVMSLGAGDIDRLVPAIKEVLKQA